MFDIARDPKVWERIRNDDAFARHRKELTEAYAKYFAVKPRCATAWEVLDFPNVGGGSDHFRQLQTVALLALIYPDNEEYYKSLVEVVWEICNEYTWAPLGHYNDYYNRTPQDFDPGLIDIFAASLAFSMAEIKSLFKDRFPKLLNDRISYEIRRHTIEPYVNRKFFWENHGNNWTAVCTGAVGGVLMYEDPEEFKKQLPRLQKSMECYLDSYDDDGMCVEGTAYWGFGFGFFCNYAMLEREFTKGEVDWFKKDKIKAISKYIQKMYIQPEVVASYSDCNFKEVYWYGLPHMLSTVYPGEIEKLPMLNVNLLSYVHFTFGLRCILYFNPENVATKLENCTYYAENCSYFTKRTDSYGFTCKGGDNGESHNHRDVGSFIFARNNKSYICDLGYPGPTAKTPDYHGGSRYKYFNPSSFSHNIPFFGENQGQEGCSKEPVSADYDKKTDSVTMNLEVAYCVEGLERYKRTFYFTDDEILMHDKFKADKGIKITERFVTTTKPRVKGSTVALDDVHIVGSDNSTLKIAEVPYSAQFPDENGSFDQICYCLDFVLNEGEKDFKLKIIAGKK